MNAGARISIAALALSATGLVGIILHEGYSDKAIIPIPGDVPTIGFGTTDGVRIGDSITPPRAVARALNDVQKFEGAIKRCVKVELHQYEYDAYTSLAYNIGPDAFCKSTLVRKLNARDYSGACSEIMRWNKAGGRVVQGLVNRRAQEFVLCEGRAHGN